MKTPDKLTAKKVEADWKKNKEKRMAETGRRIREPNELMTLLRETYLATGEPHILVLHRILIFYGFGNFKGSVRRRLKRLKTELLCAAIFPSHLAVVNGQNSSREKTYAAIAAQVGVVANSLDAAAKQVARAHRALRNTALTSDGNTGLLLLVGVAKELDELSALQRDIRGALSEIVNDPGGRKKEEQPRLKKQKSKDLRLVKLQLQQNGTRLAEHFNRAQDIMSKVPRQITLTDIRWAEDNRATRQAIADGRLVELCRTQTPVG
jgi:hypothetical protein